MIILKAIISLVLTIIPVSVLIRDWKFHDKRTKKHHNITRFIIIFWCIGSFAATFFVVFDSFQINTLSAKITELTDVEKVKQKERVEKIKTVAQRAQNILAEGNLFIGPFLSKHGADNLYNAFHEKMSDKNNGIYSEDEILKQLKDVFVRTNMLEPSSLISNGRPVSEIVFFHFQMEKVFSEVESILQHYGDLDHNLIKIIDDIHGRSKMFVKMLPLFQHIEGGIQGAFKDGVPEQWADFFSSYYLTHYRCKVLCDKILK